MNVIVRQNFLKTHKAQNNSSFFSHFNKTQISTDFAAIENNKDMIMWFSISK